MRYQLVGPKIPHVGKPLWEILGNLKNFGVGRLFLRSLLLRYPEPSFFRIVKVQPVPPPSGQFEDRNVLVWTEEVYRGKKIENILYRPTNSKPDFILIPKLEEEKYLKLQEDFSKHFKLKTIPKYCSWPPLYKLLWETWNSSEKGELEEIPKLKTKILNSEFSLSKLGDSEETSPPYKSDLFAQNASVEEMIKEIVKLEKKTNNQL